MEHQANTTLEVVPQRRTRKWFIVLLILLCLAGVFCYWVVSESLPALRRIWCNENVRTINLAFHIYHDKHGSFPPAYTVDENGQPLHSWRVLILPFVFEDGEGLELYNKIRHNEPWDSEYNQQFHGVQILAYQCPAKRATFLSKIRNVFVKNRDLLHLANCDYSVVIGEDTVFPGSTTVTSDDIIDRKSNTILVVERMIPVNWMDPNNEIRFDIAREGINRNLHGIGSEHLDKRTGGAIVGFADASWRFLPDTTENIESLLTKSAGD